MSRHDKAIVVVWWLASWWRGGAWLLWCSKWRGTVRRALEEEDGVRQRWGMEGEERWLGVLIAARARVRGAPVILIVRAMDGTHGVHPTGGGMDTEV